jgi:DNA-binding NtrC family response regulator
MSIAFKFEGYRVLLVHNQDGFWDDIHLRLVDTDCSLFAVNSAKDALSLITMMNFDIIISDSQLSDSSGMTLLQSASMTNQDAVKIMHHRKSDDDIRWHLILEGVDALDQKYLEIYGILSILSDPSSDKHERTGHDIGRVFEELRVENSVSLH